MTEHKLGISVYPDLRSLDEIIDYMKLASKYGVTRLFSSMFSVEGTAEEILDLFLKMNDAAHECGIETSLDINPDLIEKVGASENDLSAFKDIHCDILRLDVPFMDERDAALINNPYGLRMEWNTSILPEAFYDNLINNGVKPEQILTCHNFYPAPYTGLRQDKFLSLSRMVHDKGARTAAFIASHNSETHGVWDAKYGLCTVERMRKDPIDLQARKLLAMGCIDDILIGNAYASEEEFASLQKAMEVKELTDENPMKKVFDHYHRRTDGPQVRVRVNTEKDITENEKKILFDFFPHSDAGDSSEWIWRSRMPRLFQPEEGIPVREYSGKEFPRGSVLMVNNNYRHYACEVRVALLPLENDGLHNLIGTIDESEMELFDFINPGDSVVFFE